MADKFLITNNAATTLQAGITNVATSLSVPSGKGALFPSPGANERFAVTLADAAGNIEVVYCTSRSTDTLTVIRAQEGTSGRAWSAGDRVELRVTKAMLENMVQYEPGGDVPKHTEAHAIAEVTSLQTALDGKAAGSHTHAVADITDAGTNAGGDRTVSTSAPSGGVNGDIWYVV